MTHKQVRRKYLDYFKSPPRSHQEIPSSPLIPEGDPTTLFTSSGMQPLVPYLLGEKHPLGKRLVNSQKCFRAQDIDEVGDNRHTTFFEMLGNWSLGDYFKKKQLNWFFDFLVNTLKLPPDRLYVTVFEGNKEIPQDKESIKIWQEIFSKVGIIARINERIFTYPVAYNWWSRSGIPKNMPPGEPGGPDSEVFFKFEIKHDKRFGEKCHPNCDCGQFLEIGNSVFMEYIKQKDGSFKKLKSQNVDFGGGLERLIAATENEPDIFKIDLFFPLISQVEKMTRKNYHDKKSAPSMRVIADHIKAAAFLISDGVVPSNKKQGYILRRLIRRAGVKLYELTGDLGKDSSFTKLIESTYKIYQGIYFDKQTNLSYISKIVDNELAKFAKTIKKGMKIIEKLDKIDGKTAFDLYQSYGFPFEITQEILSQKKVELSRESFDKEFKKHQKKSRTASKGMFKGGLADQSEEVVKLHTATHLLQQALREILGSHVVQKGSHITSKRLRFDFYHGAKLTNKQIKKVEGLVNEKIRENLSVTYKIISLSKAKKKDALTVPNVTYPEKVKVYTIGGLLENDLVFSKEVCGGPHVDFTGKLGLFKILKEEAIGAQERRIYASLKCLNDNNRKNTAKKRS